MSFEAVSNRFVRSILERHNYIYYRMIHLLGDLGWVDISFLCSAVCTILLRLMRIGQKRLES